MAESGPTVRRGQGTLSAAEVLERRQTTLDQRKEEVRQEEKEETLADREDQTPDEAEAKAKELAEFEASVIQILSQGVTTHALNVTDPDPNKRYVWVREDGDAISRMRSLGYVLEKEKGEGMHDAGDDRRRVGDVVLMSIPMDRYKIIQEVQKREKARRVADPIKKYKKQSEQGVAAGTAVPHVDLIAEGG